MYRIFRTTSKKEYISPKITVDELEKHDVLTASDNRSVEGDSLNYYRDLFTSIFE